MKHEPKVVGLHRLTMKTDSDNFRQAAIFDIMKQLRAEGIEVVIYEPNIDTNKFEGYRVESSLETFKLSADVIVANRMSGAIEDVRDKVYTRDVYNSN